MLTLAYDSPGVRANRAGTRGFRAPEVLLKCPDQTVGACEPRVRYGLFAELVPSSN